LLSTFAFCSCYEVTIAPPIFCRKELPMHQLSFSEAQAFVLENAKQRGVSIEVYASQKSSTTIKAYVGEVSDFKLSKRAGLGLRALIKGAWGYSYTENLSEPALLHCLENALENASLVAPESHAALAAHPEPPHVGDLYGEGLSGVSVDRKVAVALELDRAVRQADKRVVSVPHIRYTDGESEIAIANTQGLERNYKTNYVVQYAMPLVSENGQSKTGVEWQFSREFESLDPTRTALQAVEKSVAKLGAKIPTTGKYPVLIRNQCMAKLLGTYSSIFSAKMVQEQKSPLTGKLGQSIGSSLVKIVDNATRPAGIESRPFDAEGYPSQDITLVENGVLKTFLHNTETAAKDGVQSTGHASRSGYRGTIGISTTNFYLEAGKGSEADLMQPIEAGVLLTDIKGTHAGVNKITGEFSLQAEGFWIENGKIAYPLENFTVAGNFLELLVDVKAIGEDLDFGISGDGAPSVRVKVLAVGGI
jgi:PmbA protein